VTTEQQLRDKLRKITALFEGAATAGERQAAAAAMERVRQTVDAAVKTQPLPETKFSLTDQWQKRLFLALCRRYGLEPYRYKGQRYTTVIVRAPRSFVEKTLWPEYVALQRALYAYLNEATERIIREEVWKDAREPAERTGS
jgi:tRNA nucleotidyltransferase (CCA-adding enzyme)